MFAKIVLYLVVLFATGLVFHMIGEIYADACDLPNKSNKRKWWVVLAILSLVGLYAFTTLASLVWNS